MKREIKNGDDYRRMFWLKKHECDWLWRQLEIANKIENKLIFEKPSMRWWVFWGTLKYRIMCIINPPLINKRKDKK